MIVTFLKEFEHFLRSHKQWWCHFDDDNYVNVAALLDTLDKYEADKPWYLGKTSTASPLKIVHPKAGSVRELHVILQYLKHLFFLQHLSAEFLFCHVYLYLYFKHLSQQNSSFWFATGGAGFCVSRTLALRMAPLAVDGGFVQVQYMFVLYCSIWGKIMSNPCHFVILCFWTGW